MRADETITFTAKPFRALILPYPLTFAPPYAERGTNPDGFSYWWQLLQFVVDLPDPAKFPRLSNFDEDDRRILRRYLACCEDLAESTLLSHTGGITVQPELEEELTVDLPSKEAIRGTATLFRQLHSTEEPASFSSARKVIGRRLHEQSDELRDQRDEWQRRWRQAGGKLNGSLLTYLADKKAAQGYGAHESLPIPGGDVLPQEVLSLFQYGDLIHWGRHASDLQALAKDPFQYQWTLFHFVEVLIQLSHFYLGYAILVRASLGDS